VIFLAVHSEELPGRVNDKLMKIIEGIREDKKMHLERLLDKGTVMLFVDSRRPEVQVPDQHRDNPQLTLNLDYAFQIPDFKILEEGIEASLSFNRVRVFCRLPFNAIYALRSDSAGEMVFFIEDAPTDLHAPSSEIPEEPQPEIKKPLLQDVSVIGGEVSDKKEKNKASGSEQKKKKKTHLRLIK
jgi:stringent starvation protein B